MEGAFPGHDRASDSADLLERMRLAKEQDRLRSATKRKPTPTSVNPVASAHAAGVARMFAPPSEVQPCSSGNDSALLQQYEDDLALATRNSLTNSKSDPQTHLDDLALAMRNSLMSSSGGPPSLPEIFPDPSSRCSGLVRAPVLACEETRPTHSATATEPEEEGLLRNSATSEHSADSAYDDEALPCPGSFFTVAIGQATFEPPEALPGPVQSVTHYNIDQNEDRAAEPDPVWLNDDWAKAFSKRAAAESSVAACQAANLEQVHSDIEMIGIKGSIFGVSSSPPPPGSYAGSRPQSPTAHSPVMPWPAPQRQIQQVAPQAAWPSLAAVQQAQAESRNSSIPPTSSGTASRAQCSGTTSGANGLAPHVQVKVENRNLSSPPTRGGSASGSLSRGTASGCLAPQVTAHSPPSATLPTNCPGFSGSAAPPWPATNTSCAPCSQAPTPCLNLDPILAQAASALGDIASGNGSEQSRSALASLLGDWKAHSEKVVAISQKNIQQELNQGVSQLIIKVDENTQRQLKAQQAHITAHTAQIQNLEVSIKELKDQQNACLTQVARCQEVVAAANTVPSAYQLQRDHKWDSDPDPRLIRAHVHQLISLTALRSALTPWLAKSDFLEGTHFHLPDDDGSLQDNFVIQFVGPDGTAAKRSTAALSSLRQGAGRWQKIFAKTPTGKQTQIYLSADKNLCQQATEVITKKLATIIEKMIGSEFGAARTEEVVLVAREPLALLTPASTGEVTIKWSESLANRTQINRQAAVSALEEDRAASNKSIAARLAATQRCL